VAGIQALSIANAERKSLGVAGNIHGLFSVACTWLNALNKTAGG